MDTTGYYVAIWAMFIMPLIAFVMLFIFFNKTKYKISKAIYFGWIPANILSCWYFGQATSFTDGMILFIFCQYIQLVMVVTGWHLLRIFCQGAGFFDEE
jgi:hypothetical protein